MNEIERVDENHLRYRGFLFMKDKRNGYYFGCCRKLTGVSLHKYVLRTHGKDIPEGCEVHHIDGDKANNEIENLVVMDRDEHRIMHQLEKVGYTQKFEGKCLQCGKEISKDRPWAIFDTKACKQAYARRLRRYDVKAKCEMCGEEFVTNKYIKGKVCHKCRSKRGLETRLALYGVRQKCVYCGDEFISLNGAKHCPKRECLCAYKREAAKIRRMRGKSCTPQ